MQQRLFTVNISVGYTDELLAHLKRFGFKQCSPESSENNVYTTHYFSTEKIFVLCGMLCHFSREKLHSFTME